MELKALRMLSPMAIGQPRASRSQQSHHVVDRTAILETELLNSLIPEEAMWVFMRLTNRDLNIFPTSSRKQNSRYEEGTLSGFAGLLRSARLARFQSSGKVLIFKHTLKVDSVVEDSVS